MLKKLLNPQKTNSGLILNPKSKRRFKNALLRRSVLCPYQHDVAAAVNFRYSPTLVVKMAVATGKGSSNQRNGIQKEEPCYHDDTPPGEFGISRYSPI
jgi:hypothetical protein